LQTRFIVGRNRNSTSLPLLINLLDVNCQQPLILPAYRSTSVTALGFKPKK